MKNWRFINLVTLQQDLKITQNSLFPIDTSFRSDVSTYQSAKKNLDYSIQWHITAFGIWMNRLTNEDSIELAIELDQKQSVVHLAFSQDSTADEIYKQVVLESTEHLSNDLKLVFSSNNYHFESYTCFLNEKNIERYEQYYTIILAAILENPNIKIAQINLMTAWEHQLYQKLNQTEQDTPIDQTMHDVFDQTAQKYPQKVALQDATKTLTFSEIQIQADSIAQLLIEKGIQVGDYVAVYMQRSMEAIISMLGVMKAGAIYVPLSPDNPDERNEYILKDTQAKFVLTDAITTEKAITWDEQIPMALYTQIEEKTLVKKPTVKPTDLAYIIYTSGSTGRPKGVKIPHKSIATFAYAEKETYGFSEHHILTQFYTLTFDASLLELCPMIFHGNTLYMLSKEERLDISLFAEAIHEHRIDYIMMVPMSALKQYLLFATEEDIEKLQRLQCFGVGGETLPLNTVRLFQEKFGLIPLKNVYGPTECSVLTTTYTIDTLLPKDLMTIPIGTPLPNYRVHILNDGMAYCPIGVTGELYIETTALAEGYLHLPEKTDEVFVMTPHSENRMYRSGDLVRLLPNGQIEFVGRKDTQVKIRGYRVELGEIEEHLLAIPEITDGAIIAKEIQGDLSIVAYYQVKDGVTYSTEQVVDALKQQVPAYMLPAYVIELEEFPLLPSGKINRTALKERELDVQVQVKHTENQLAPVNDEEAIILKAWQDVLLQQDIGTNEDFFEIGGHSLKVLAILTQLKKQFPMLKINDFFEYRTVQALANYVRTAEAQEEVVKETKQKELFEHPKSLHSMTVFKPITQQSILLTGATGYLGAHLLIDLLKHPEVTEVSVLVRATSKEHGLKRILEQLRYYEPNQPMEELLRNTSLRIILGDFTQPNLGASFKDLMWLQTNVQALIHCGADVRHFGDAEHFKKTNIDSTAYLIDFAKQCTEIRFHYVSTLGIQEDLASEGKWDDFLTKDSILDAPDVESLYTNSKLASEKLLQQAHTEGLPVTIYRPGNISCQSTTGIFQKNIDSNAVYRMFKSFILLEKAPNVNFMMDFTMVDYASSLITNIALSNDTIGGIYNICNTTLISFKDVLQHFRKFGYTIELVDEQEFINFLYDDSKKDAEGLALAMAGLEGDGAKNSSLLYACPQSELFMTQNQLVCPKPDETFFEHMIQQAIQQHYFPEIKK